MANYTPKNTKNKPYDLRRIPYYITLALLTTGASLILGFLSFSGMYALAPMLPMAFAAFFLSVTYEGEIYLQNIKSALKKLFQSDHLKMTIAKEFLLANFPEHLDESCPRFFKDYQTQLFLLNQFSHKELTPNSKKRQAQIQQTLNDMEVWFTQQVFADKQKKNAKQTEYAQSLALWLSTRDQQSLHKQYQKRSLQFNLVKAFSTLSALFMGLGCTYLTVEAFTAIPAMAAIPFALWPMIIVPMAAISGIAYGLLTYNAITDLISNNTLVKWYQKLRDDLSKGITVKNVFMASAAIFLVALAVALTICTAGTWWTVASNAKPLFDWLKKMPNFVMGIINPAITGLSSVSFITQNTAESLEMIDDALNSQKSIIQQIKESIEKGWQHVLAHENWLQIFNPFRIAIKLTITPLRILLFLGHLVSIALTADRMPGVPQLISALIAFISEGFEDAHYFVGNAGHHDEHASCNHPKDAKELLKERLADGPAHSHDADIPTKILNFVTTPVYALAALFDTIASKLNTKDKHLTLKQAWCKHIGSKEPQDITATKKAKRPSQSWKKEHALMLIDKECSRLQETSADKPLAGEKTAQLKQLANTIVACPNNKALKQKLLQEQGKPVYNAHRLFALQSTTRSQAFIDALPERIGLQC
jgi:hypothetical protein